MKGNDYFERVVTRMNVSRVFSIGEDDWVDLVIKCWRIGRGCG